jgi:hypoxanthine phosphoribosyltransferase
MLPIQHLSYSTLSLEELDETPRVAAEIISRDVCGKKILIVDDNVGVV